MMHFLHINPILTPLRPSLSTARGQKFQVYSTMFVDQQLTVLYGDIPSTQYCRIKNLSTRLLIIYNVMYVDIMKDENIVLCVFNLLTSSSLYHRFPFSTTEYLSLGGEWVVM